MVQATVAIILPVHRGVEADHLCKCLTSIEKQTVVADLMLVQDGPLTERQTNVLELHNVEPVVRYRENQGLAKALNGCLELVYARGYKYIIRMDSDDLMSPSRIHEQVCALEEMTEVDVLGGQAEIIDNVGRPIGQYCKAQDHVSLVGKIFLETPFIHPSVAFRAAKFRAGEVFYSENCILYEDIELWLRLEQLGFRFANLPLPILSYRLDISTLARRSSWKRLWGEYLLKLRYWRRVGEPTKLDLLKRMLSIQAIFFVRLIAPAKLVRFVYAKKFSLDV